MKDLGGFLMPKLQSKGVVRKEHYRVWAGKGIQSRRHSLVEVSGQEETWHSPKRVMWEALEPLGPCQPLQGFSCLSWSNAQPLRVIWGGYSVTRSPWLQGSKWIGTGYEWKGEASVGLRSWEESRRVSDNADESRHMLLRAFRRYLGKNLAGHNNWVWRGQTRAREELRMQAWVLTLSVGRKIEPLAQTRNPGVWPSKQGLRAISMGC